jgi:hypothetical protein
MSDPVNLAGVIGTWVAVFLAIVPLAGVLPAYLLYRKSRTEKAQALAVVDDPTRTFVSRGFGLLACNSTRLSKCQISDTRLTYKRSSLRQNGINWDRGGRPPAGLTMRMS